MRYFVTSWALCILLTVAITTWVWGMKFANVLFGLTGGFFIGLVVGIVLTEAVFGLHRIRAGVQKRDPIPIK